MAKVFSYEAIEQNRVPQISDFVSANHLITSEVSSLVESGDIHGAIKFGSVGYGEPSRRSDYDLFTVVKNDGRQKIKEVFRLVYQTTQVAVEPASLPIHSGLRRHLGRMVSSQNLIGENPLTTLPPPGDTILSDFTNYLIAKIARLNKGYYDPTGTERLKTIQRSLEVPTNVGRMALEAFGKLDGTQLLTDDKKSAVIAKFRDYFAATQLVEGTNVILAQDKTYNQLLDHALGGTVSKQEYEAELTQIEGVVVIAAIKWTEQLSEAFMNKLSYLHI